MCASRALLYHLQGSFAETHGREEQLHWIQTNARDVFELGGLQEIFTACKRACYKHDWVSALPDAPAPGTQPMVTPEEKAELLEEVNVEITVHFAQLYAVLETMRGAAELGEALMCLSPPLPVYLLERIAALREKSIKGFPVKKLVLLFWKSLLGTLGGLRDVARCKRVARELQGLPAEDARAQEAPTAPSDLRTFQGELSAKYPTLATREALAAKAPAAAALASTIEPLPPRHDEAPESPVPANGDDAHALVLPNVPPAGVGNGNGPLPPRAGKQKYQTDQSRPFVFPYTAGGVAVPASIREAVALYQQHLYVPTRCWQLWHVRQQYLDEASAADAEAELSAARLGAMRLDEDPQRAQDVQRLQWVDELYCAALPHLQSGVIVLLKLVLATMTSGNTNSAYARALADRVPADEAPAPTLEDVDITRHREILNKSISAILLLCLKWFRTSHVLKFEYLAQIMLDSNVLLLILKIFGLQEVSQSIASRSEARPFGLFEYCRVVGAHDAPPANLQELLASAELRIGDVFERDTAWRAALGATQAGPAYSWRNFAACSNFTRILQKLTKNKVHRILLLVQYKSTAILKRTLKVHHTRLQHYVLKLIRSQVPFCGRKWRQSNMRIITLIYLHCRPTLRDDWLVGSDVDADVEASLPEEQTLRTLIRFYNASRFPPRARHDAAAYPGARAADGAAPSDAPPLLSDAASTVFERDAFPHGRRTTTSSTPGRYISDQAVEGSLDAYEDVIHELLGAPDTEPPEAAWTRFDKLLGTQGAAGLAEHGKAEEPAGEEGAAAPSSPPPGPRSAPATPAPPPADRQDENRNDWEHLSPREMRHLSAGPLARPSSPLPEQQLLRRTRSLSHSRLHKSDSGVRLSPLQPPIHWGAEQLVEDALATEESDEAEPVQALDTPLPSPKPGGIDEVEHVFGA